ncbi:uncharacterized protein Pyn_05540 [Prunus yedoensis var. nudiflora]|uniref:Uncharacterized protein n=1 Tax=Prunus yedoensis var. nudiflora TaxID=2094558 RepID=A0A314YL89_PRUYE|nr:uncharacterized protein Pyn_05540 [Prunus yedoensis var. nudiflora]
MVEKPKDPEKSYITEEDTANLLPRYKVGNVLQLLQEVAHSQDVKIDWNRLVEKTSTGISNAREYQMLWRHLAYSEAFVDKFDNGDQPVDDDSDLEHELEAFPAVSGEDSTEAAACVKVLIASGLPSDSTHRSGATVEAPLTINIPNGQPSRTHQNSQPTCSMQGMNITVPVSVQKQPLLATITSTGATAEGGDANGPASNNMAPRKKRKKWSEAEDLELIAGVRRYGEGNWANILRGDFKGERTANQLSQRWKYIRKHHHQDLNVGGNSSNKLSEAQLATRHAMSLALNMPSITANTIGTVNLVETNATTNPLPSTAAEEELQSQQGLKPAKPYQMGLLGSTSKSQVTSKRTLTKPNSNTDGMVRATAVAAGARIASPSDAASLLKAAQAKNAVHVLPTGGSSIQSSLPGSMRTHPEPHSNLHYMHTGLAATPVSTPLSTAVTPSATHPGSLKALPQTSQQPPTNSTLLSKQIKDVSCSLDSEPGCTPTEQVQHGAVISENGQSEEGQKDKVDSPDQKAELKNLLTSAENVVGSLDIKGDETDNIAGIGVQSEERRSAKDNETLCSLKGDDPFAADSCENQSASEQQIGLVSIVGDGCNGKQVLGKEETGIKI